MDHLIHTAFESSSDDYSSSKVDIYGFDSLLGHDASLTQGLDSLGTCNNNENACLDQRCFDHYGKTSARNKTLDIGLDITTDSDPRHFKASDIKHHPHDTKSKTRSRSASEMASGSLQKSHGQNQKRKKLHGQTFHAHDMPPPQQPIYHVHQPYRPLHHVSYPHQAEPISALQSLNETIQHGLHLSINHNIQPSLNDFHHIPPQSFSLSPSPHPQWPHPTASSWGNMLHQSPVANYFPIFSPTHMTYDDAASAACSSACNDVKCWSQCGDGADPNCCFDASCADLDFSDACCFEPECTAQDPCLDAHCQEASIPCSDANCVGTTTSTTPTSVSVTTPSVEPEPAVVTVRSPVGQCQNVQFDINQGFGHDLGHNFSAGLCPDFTHDLDPGLGRQMAHGHSLETNHDMEHAGLFVVPRPVTTKTEVADSKSVSEEAEFTCRWACGNGVLCGQTFLSSKELQDHCKNEHVKSLKKASDGFCCAWNACLRPGPFSQKSKLERHMQTHTGCRSPISFNLKAI